MTTIVIVLFAAVCAAQALDVYSTYQIITQQKGYESNPIMAWFISKLGTGVGLLVPKSAAVALLDYVLFYSGVPAQAASVVLAVVLALYVYVVWNNFKILNG